MKASVSSQFSPRVRILCASLIAISLIAISHSDGFALIDLGNHFSNHVPSTHVIKAGTQIEAKVLRSTCDDDFAVGDTVSAKVRPASVALSRPKWWPKEFLVVLRRSAPTNAREKAYLRVSVINATINQKLVPEARGVLSANVEAITLKAGNNGVNCYAQFEGILTRTLHVR